MSTFALHQNYPNPFNPSTTIQFDLPQAGEVELRIYNTAGQLVRTLASGDYAPGEHNVIWNARDETGQRVASGVYVYAIRVRNAAGGSAGRNFVARRKLVLMK